VRTTRFLALGPPVPGVRRWVRLRRGLGFSVHRQHHGVVGAYSSYRPQTSAGPLQKWGRPGVDPVATPGGVRSRAAGCVRSGRRRSRPHRRGCPPDGSAPVRGRGRGGSLDMEVATRRRRPRGRRSWQPGAGFILLSPSISSASKRRAPLGHVSLTHAHRVRFRQLGTRLPAIKMAFARS